MPKAKMKSEVIFANYHTPVEHRSVIPAPLDEILSTQELSLLKRIVVLYFSHVYPTIPAVMKNKGIKVKDELLIFQPHVLSHRTSGSTSISRYASVYENLQEEVEESFRRQALSVKEQTPEAIGDALYEFAKSNLTNVITVTPDAHSQLTGKSENFRKLTTTIIERVKLNNDFTVEVKFSSFMNQVRNHLINQVEQKSLSIFNNPNLISLDINEIRHFRSQYAIQLYMLIARTQFTDNKLIIGVAELASYLGWTQGIEGNKKKAFFKYFTENIVLDPGLMRSTCALIPVTYANEKKQRYYLPAEKNKKVITAIEIRFKNNAELKESLLNKNYNFIRHMSGGNINESTLVQIVKRVYDGILEERYVNFCINKAYIHIEMQPEKSKETKDKDNDITSLAWGYMKRGEFKDSYLDRPDLWDLSQPKGISISKYKRDNEQTSLFSNIERAKSDSISDENFWKHIESFFTLNKADYVKYAREHIKPESMRNALKSPDSTQESLKSLILDYFITNHKKEIKSYMTQLGFSANKAEILVSILPERIKENLFSFYEDGKFNPRKEGEWRNAMIDDFKSCLSEFATNIDL